MLVYGGIDFKLREVSVGVIATHPNPRIPDKVGVATLTLDKKQPYTVALGWMYDAVRAAYTDALADAGLAQPAVVGGLTLAEQPAGRFFPRKLTMALGVILASMGGIDVEINTWREAVLGDPKADKDDAVAHVKKKWKLDLVHDEAEALCIAEYAMQEGLKNGQ